MIAAAENTFSRSLINPRAPLLTWPLPRAPGKLKPARHPEPTAWPNTISCCESKRSWAGRHGSTVRWRFIDKRRTVASGANSVRKIDRLPIREGRPADVEPLTRLINAAFVVERVVFDGDRVDAAEIRAYMRKGTFLVAEEVGEFVACVYVE